VRRLFSELRAGGIRAWVMLIRIYRIIYSLAALPHKCHSRGAIRFDGVGHVMLDTLGYCDKIFCGRCPIDIVISFERLMLPDDILGEGVPTTGLSVKTMAVCSPTMRRSFRETRTAPVSACRVQEVVVASIAPNIEC
jgi:hypothetical protein